MRTPNGRRHRQSVSLKNLLGSHILTLWTCSKTLVTTLPRSHGVRSIHRPVEPYRRLKLNGNDFRRDRKTQTTKRVGKSRKSNIRSVQSSTHWTSCANTSESQKTGRPLNNSLRYSPTQRKELKRLFPRCCQEAAKLRQPVKRATRLTKNSHQPSQANTPNQLPDLTRYRDDPVGFAKDILKVELWEAQQNAALSILTGKRRLLVESGHSVGKTFLAAVLVVWWYYTRPRSVIITTAPTLRDVVDLLWNQVRQLVRQSGLPDHFIGPSAPEMRDPEAPQDHWAKGYTASTGESFQGRHFESMLFVFDEAEGLIKSYWTTTNTMFKPGEDHCWFAICNPTTSTSQRYQERRALDIDGGRKWNLMSFSALQHPNIASGIANRERERNGLPAIPIPYPNAVTVDQVDSWLGEWFEPVSEAERDLLLDVEYPPRSGQWWRPGPDGEARVLGRTPTAGTYGIWSETLWRLACAKGPPGDDGVPTPRLMGSLGEIPEIGCDVARYGDDRTEIHSRHGPCSLSHEDHGGWDTVRTANRCMELADELAEWYNSMRPPQAAKITGKQIPIKVDDTGVGGGVTDILASNGYAVVAVNAGSSADDPTRYPLIRDELWFTVRDMAKAGELDLSRLSPKVLNRLETQALAPTWRPTPDRRRKVETKEDTKKRIGRSPDGMDSVNLAYYRSGGIVGAASWIGGNDRDDGSANRRGGWRGSR